MNMPIKQIKIPKFRTEAHEAEWWDSHPEVAAEIMRRAIKAGNARRAVPLKTVTMRLPVPDIQAAQDLAERKGLPYQTYMKMLLHEALEKERRTGPSPT
jgi:predicted DNA binding CopG/RHH family protein